MEQLSCKKTSGFSIIEVLIAIGIFSIVAKAGIGAFITSTHLHEQATESQVAYRYAASGLEAVRNIKDEDFLLLENGTHGLEVSGGEWSLSGNSNKERGYTRMLEISEVADEIKEVTARVSWENRSGLQEITLTTQLTDWEKQMEMALFLSVNVSNAFIPAQDPKDLLGIRLENTGTRDITIDSIWATWGPAVQRKLNAVVIDSILVWSNSGPGTPSGAQPPGSTVDIVDVTLPAGGGPITIDKFDFNGHIKDNTFDITFMMTDGSEVTITNIVPPII